MKAVEGDKALLVELVGVFAQSYPRRLIDLREAIMAGDTNRTERTAHSLKGEIGLLGATTAYSLAETLKTMGREAQRDSAAHSMQELGRELEQVASFLNQPGWGIVHECTDLLVGHPDSRDEPLRVPEREGL
jgi:HPt (histidine-containing phosphotransfer) domain-containing protein